jgi:hypothetical protein
MEAWDDRDKVRPIPIEDGSARFDGSPPEPPDPHRPRRPWVPVAIAVVALLIVIGSVSVFGALRFDDPQARDPDFSASSEDDEGSTTTATVLPPRLDELLPGTTDRLTLMAVDQDGVWALLWDPSFREPKAVPLGTGHIDPDAVDLAAFDPSGRSVAVRSCDGTILDAGTSTEVGRTDCDLYVGTPTDIGLTPDIQHAADFIWHASEVNRIAWIQLDPTNGTWLKVASVNPLSGRLQDQEFLFPVDAGTDIVQWDRYGFVLSDGTTTAYGQDGSPLWSIPGHASTGTDTTIAIAGDASTWTLVDRVDGSELPISIPSRSLVYVATSDSADLLGRLAEFGSSYSLTITGGGMQAPRIVNLRAMLIPIGFSAEGQYFLSRTDEGNTISFVDWRTGAAKDITVADGYRIIGLDIG